MIDIVRYGSHEYVLLGMHVHEIIGYSGKSETKRVQISARGRRAMTRDIAEFIRQRIRHENEERKNGDQPSARSRRSGGDTGVEADGDVERRASRVRQAVR